MIGGKVGNEPKSFTQYCEEHPGERFWQALRNWSKYDFILGIFGDDSIESVNGCLARDGVEDTFYEEANNG